MGDGVYVEVRQTSYNLVQGGPSILEELIARAAERIRRSERIMRPGSRDFKVKLLIDGEELAQLKRHTWQMAEAFGLDSRIERYYGKRSIGFYRGDMDCLIDVVNMALDDRREYPTKDSPGYAALRKLAARLKDEYQWAFEGDRKIEPNAPADPGQPGVSQPADPGG